MRENFLLYEIIAGFIFQIEIIEDCLEFVSAWLPLERFLSSEDCVSFRFFFCLHLKIPDGNLRLIVIAQLFTIVILTRAAVFAVLLKRANVP